MPLSDEQKKAAAVFPEALWSPEHRICIFRPEGELTGRVVARLLEWLEAIELDIPEPFSRFTDLTKLGTVGLTQLDVENLAFWRRSIYGGALVKSGFLAGSSETCRVAEKYQTLMEGSRILVSVFRSIEEAARWLRVPRGAIEAPKATGGREANSAAPKEEKGTP
jgi:hypothetical protein